MTENILRMIAFLCCMLLLAFTVGKGEEYGLNERQLWMMTGIPFLAGSLLFGGNYLIDKFFKRKQGP